MSDDIDGVLANEDSIVPSSGFTLSVMEAVRREAETPPPIPFPWKRALPGLVYCVGALITFFIFGLSGLSQPGGGTELSNRLTRILLTRITDIAKDAGVGWIAIALLVSLASVVFSMRVVRAKG